MLIFSQIIEGEHKIISSVTLTYDQRVKSRLKVELNNGEPAGLFLPRGNVLKNGDKIAAETGEVVSVEAANETVSTVLITDPQLMARPCYHLGNPHVAWQLYSDSIRYHHDHLLHEMLASLRLSVICDTAPFEPLPGAYHNSSHSNHGH